MKKLTFFPSAFCLMIVDDMEASARKSAFKAMNTLNSRVDGNMSKNKTKKISTNDVLLLDERSLMKPIKDGRGMDSGCPIEL